MTTQRRRRTTINTRAISDQWLQYVRGSLAESAAATFTQSTINLPVVVGQGLVIEAHLVEFQLDSVTPADLTATDDSVRYSCQLTKASQTGLISLADPNYIYGLDREYQTIDIQTAEKAPVLTHDRLGSLNWQFPEPILLPFEQIFFGVQTNGGSAAKTYRFRIGYKTVRLSTRQLPELIQAVT